MHFALILTAAGSSSRFGKKKEYLPLQDEEQTVLSCSLTTFLKTNLFTTCIITIPKGEEKIAEQAVEDAKNLAKEKNIPLYFIEGGNTRQESVFKGLLFLEHLQTEKKLQNSKDSKNYVFTGVMIHDGARPWVTEQTILDTARLTALHGAACPAIPTVDTCKQVDKTGKIISHINRETLYAVQTPQSFIFSDILRAHKLASTDNKVYTDDTEIWAGYIGDVYISKGEFSNKKITFKTDLCE